jgi:hypothetical protein
VIRPAVGNEMRLAPAKLVVLVLVVGALLFAADGSASAAGSASVSITPGPAKGAFTDQQNVRVSVGPNSVFTPNSRVVILECADPDGTVANLPTGFSSCDENTIEPDTTVVHADGSFVEPSYMLYVLPSKVLGEQANWQPVCNPTHPCVLFVGEDQNDFSKAKTFSAAFTMSGGTLSAAPATATTTPATTASAPVSAAVSLSVTQLAFTGTSGWLLALAAIGAALILLAWALTTLVRRSVR